MSDVIDIIGEGSVIQHGKMNDRIYLMSLKGDAQVTLDAINKLASTNNYGKIFCKVAKHNAPLFYANGFFLEAYIPKFYNHQVDVFFVSKFLNANRLLTVEQDALLNLNNLLQQNQELNLNALSTAYCIRKLDEKDVAAITQLYQNVFESYPFPIHQPEYISKTMKENIQYYGAELEGELVALSSAEIDARGENAEMTDFATQTKHSGNNLSSLLLSAMEKAMKKQGITTLYTIARLNSIPMNKTFLKFDYEYSGTLIKNTNIAGNIESMNVYYKHL